MEIKEYINSLVNECFEERSENILRENIKPLVAQVLTESLEEKKRFTSDKKGGKIKASTLVKKLMKNPKFREAARQYLSDEDAYNGWTDSLNGKKYSTLDNLSDGSKRRIVSQRLKDKKIDYAPIAYKLWPNMSQDAARSWFSKKVDGKNVSFTDEEISAIFSLLNNTIK